MSSGNTSTQAAVTPAPPADVYGFYNRLGVVLPRSHKKWVPAHCFLPGHTDRHKSMGVNTGNGGWKCFACNQKGGAYAAAVARGFARADAARLAHDYGVWAGDWKPSRARKSPPTFSLPPEPVNTEPGPERFDWKNLGSGPRQPLDRRLRRAEYPYVDEWGNPLYRVVREDLESGNKSFWQERYDGGSWQPGLGDTRRVLYRLPELLELAEEHGTLLVVEGEKNVEAVARLGVLATTNAGGAGKWDDSFSRSLRGAVVCVAPDCDPPGRRHAVSVCRSLLEAGCETVGPLELDICMQDGFDLADHLAGIAAAVRAVDPDVTLPGLRGRLREHLQALIRACLPATQDSISRYLELAEHTANPEGRLWLKCSRCGRRRSHTVHAGLAFCGCGAINE